MFPVLSTRSKPLKVPLLWERSGCWPVKNTSARISDAMRPDIYSSCSNNRIKVKGQSRSRHNGRYSKPPSKASANSEATETQLEASSPLLVLLAMDSLFATVEMVFLVTVFLAAHVAAYHKSVTDFPIRFTVKNCTRVFGHSLCK